MRTVIKERYKEKKGFTLIEVIVVIVIIAVLAAIAVPALTQYIEKAKEKAVLSEARNILTGVQIMATTDNIDNPGPYIQNDRNNGYFAYVIPGSYAVATGCDLSDKGVAELSAVLGIDPDRVKHPATWPNNNEQGLDRIKFEKDRRILGFEYYSNGYKVTYNEGEFTIEKGTYI